MMIKTQDEMGRRFRATRYNLDRHLANNSGIVTIVHY